MNLKGPALRAVIEINPSALEAAAVLDDERRLHGARSLMHGIPVLLKVGFYGSTCSTRLTKPKQDNIATQASEG